MDLEQTREEIMKKTKEAATSRLDLKSERMVFLMLFYKEWKLHTSITTCFVMFTVALEPSKKRHTKYDSISSIGPMYCKAQNNHTKTWTPFPLGLNSNVVKLLPLPSPTKSTTVA
jgi:hypothetical protein